MVVFFTCKTVMGHAWKVMDDSSRNYGIFATEDEAESKCKELQDKYD